jgi:tetratricopeptide (TPR) repeat protein
MPAPLPRSLAVALLGLACGSPAPDEAAARPVSGTAPTQASAPTPGVREDGSIVSAVDWFGGSLDEALARARTEGKLVLLDVGAYWCDPCHELDEKTFVDPGVGERLAAGYVALHVDAEKGEGPELAERYRVLAYPTLLVLEASGIEKGRIVDFVPPAGLIEGLSRIEAGGNVLEELARAATDRPGDLEAAYAYGTALAAAARRDAAIAELERVVAGDPENAAGLAAKALFDRALYLTYKIDGDPERAIAELRALQARFPAAKESIRAHRQIGRILAGQGKPDEAIAELDAMVAKDPELAASYAWFSFREKCHPEKALAVVRSAQTRTPDDAELRYLEAELSHLVGDPAGALTAIRRASELEPKKAYYRRQVRRFEELARGPS